MSLRYMATWEAKETSIIRGRERKKKKKASESVADSYQKCWACQFCRFGCQVTEIVHWWESWKCVWWMSPAIKNNNNNTKSTCASVCPSCISIRYVQCGSFQKSAGLKRSFSCLVICELLPGLYLFARHAIPQQEGIVRLDWVRGCCFL